MAKQLLPDARWAAIAPLIAADPERPRGGRPPVAAREALIGFSSSCTRRSRGNVFLSRCPHCSGMACWRGSWLGRQPACGRPVHRPASWTSSISPGKSTGRALRSTPRPFLPKRGRRDRPEPDRSRQTRIEAPHHGRSQRPAARPRPDRSQRPRQQGFDRHHRRASAAPASAWKAAKTAAQSARRQGLRLCRDCQDFRVKAGFVTPT